MLKLNVRKNKGIPELDNFCCDFSNLKVVSICPFYSEITINTYWDNEGTLLNYPQVCTSFIPSCFPCIRNLAFFYIGVIPWVVFFTGEDEDQYEQFMLPLTAAFEAVAQMFSTNSFNEQEAKVSPLPTDLSVSG